MAVKEKAPQALKMDVWEQVEFIKGMVLDLERQLPGAGKTIVDERESVRKTQQREPTLNELADAIYEQLGFLNNDTRETFHQTSKLFGYPNEKSNAIDTCEAVPSPDDIRTKLTLILNFVTQIRGTQGSVLSRLLEGIG